MHRFYCPHLPAQAGPDARVDLDAAQAGHARRTLRLAVGDALELADGQGGLARGRIVELGRDTCVVGVEEVRRVPRLWPELTLAVACPKGPRADDMVNQLSQLGVDRLILLQTQRSVAEPGAHRMERLERIAVESAKQSGRSYLMQIEPLTSLDKVLAIPATRAGTVSGDDPGDLRLLAAPGGEVQPWKALPRQAGARVLVLIGPEGGWTDAELETATTAGCRRWSLGPHILRIETAALAAASVLRYLTQNQSG